jgi:hypothetical protein
VASYFALAQARENMKKWTKAMTPLKEIFKIAYSNDNYNLMIQVYQRAGKIYRKQSNILLN